MQPGLDCGFARESRNSEQMRRTGEWVKYALALPMKYEPGTKFGYCSPGYHVLSSIVTAAAHQPTGGFRKEEFIRSAGYHRRDLAAGRTGPNAWLGRQPLLPARFRQDRLPLPARRQMERQADRLERLGSQVDHAPGGPRARRLRLRLGWWLAKSDGLDEFGGNGRGGQHMAVWPEKDMIVIVTGGGYPANEVWPGDR